MMIMAAAPAACAMLMSRASVSGNGSGGGSGSGSIGLKPPASLLKNVSKIRVSGLSENLSAVSRLPLGTRKTALSRFRRPLCHTADAADAPQTEAYGEFRDKESDSSPKASSILCSNCDGNGALVCSQCNGKGINSQDYFGDRFKAGSTCWLCRGKRQMLCGDCNGAGFLGGFLSSFED